MRKLRLLTFVLALWSVVSSLTYPSVYGAADPISPGSWSLVVLPDTQYYVEDYPETFDAQTQWIKNNRTAFNIQMVLHEGDVSDDNVNSEYDNALQSMNILNGFVPYAITTGNHDFGPNGNGSNRDSLFNDNSYFGPTSAFATQPSVGEFFETGKTDNSYHTFSGGGGGNNNDDWLVLALEFGPRDTVLDWANTVVSNHPNHKAMLVTHAYMNNMELRYNNAGYTGPLANEGGNPHGYALSQDGNGNQIPGAVNDGEEIWDKLISQHDNFRFVFSGHTGGDGIGRQSDTGINGNVVHEMLANYQFRHDGGHGLMRILEFMPDGDTVKVKTYSPTDDLHERQFDQEFTIKMSELNKPGPILYQVAAGNVLAGGLADNPENLAFLDADVPSSQTTAVPVSVLIRNRADFVIGIEGQSTAGLRHANGVLLATMAEHSRDGFIATVEVARGAFGTSGDLTLSIQGAGGNGDELNLNTSVAWFDYKAGWTAAQLDTTGNIVSASGVTQSMITQVETGRYTVDLGVNSLTDGMLFAVSNANNDDIVNPAVLEDGSGWDLRVQDNDASFSQTGIDQNFSFVYLPYDTENLIGGRYDGFAESNLNSAGIFTLTELATGRYQLTIPGETPESGMLLLNTAHRVGSTLAPDDNILSYEADGSGNFIIESRDLSGLSLEDTHFVWAFIDFDTPIENYLLGDMDGNGVLDESDINPFVEALTSRADYEADYPTVDADTIGDINGDGTFNLGDVRAFRDLFEAPSFASSVPEPSSLVLILVGLVSYGLWPQFPRPKP